MNMTSPNIAIRANTMRNLLKPLIFLTGLSIMSGPVLSQSNLPDLGDYSATVLSASEEQKLGREFMRQIRQQLRFIDDQELITYLNRLGSVLVSNSDQPGRTFTFYLVEDNALNAFAVPGGHITVHTGLITNTLHESELASVIAHEIAHVTQSHIARMIAQNKRTNIPAMAALIAAILLGGQAGTAAIMGTQAALVERQLQYSRSFEEEADAIGIQTLASAGYDPRAMPDFFGRLQQYSRSQESNAPEFLRTHPLTYSRIAESVARADQYPRIENPDETQFQLMKAKIRALYSGSDPARVAQGFAARLKENTYENLYAERYGYALALMADGQYQAARELMNELISQDPERLSYSIALADVETADGRPGNAAKAYQRIRANHPDNLVLDLYFINALIESEQYADAKKILKSHLLSRRGDPRLHKLLARAEGESGNHLAAHQELAEFYYFNGNSAEALRQLGLAKKYTGDSFYAQSSVSARIEEIQQELRIRGEKIP